MGPGPLTQVLRQVDLKNRDNNLLVGTANTDDAAVYRLNDNQALIQSIDFFTPVVDDPYIYGQIAAANALSDIYAMGGKPLMALNIVCFPSCLDEEVMIKILQGGADKVDEAGAVLAGGHTVEDEEPKYGLAATGIAVPDDIIRNSDARPGDNIILTKPLGTGIMLTALKGGMVVPGEINTIIENMARLNNIPLSVMKKYGVTACTDITGFGLLGHTFEMAAAGDVEITIAAAKVEFFSRVLQMAEMGIIPEGAYKNRDYFQDKVDIERGINEGVIDALYDPQTSGGLLMSVAAEKTDKFLDALKEMGWEDAAVIGRVTGDKPGIKIKTEL